MRVWGEGGRVSSGGCLVTMLCDRPITYCVSGTFCYLRESSIALFILSMHHVHSYFSFLHFTYISARLLQVSLIHCSKCCDSLRNLVSVQDHTNYSQRKKPKNHGISTVTCGKYEPSRLYRAAIDNRFTHVTA